MSDAADNHGSLNSDNATAPGTELETGRPLVDPRFIVEHLPQILTGLGFVIYAAVRISYQAFYGSFNLTPEAVGITYLSIVAPAAIVTCVIVLAVGLVFGPFLLLRDLPNGPDENQAARPVKRSYIGPLIILLALAVLSMFFVDADTVFEFVFLGGSSLVVFGELALIEIAERRRRPEDAPKPRYVLFPAPFWIIIAGIALAFILTASHNLGIYGAEQLKSGKPPLEGSRSLFTGFVHIEAEPVQITWTDKKTAQGVPLSSTNINPGDSSLRITYLGEKNGTVVLLVGPQCEVVRIPAASVILSSSTTSTAVGC